MDEMNDDNQKKVEASEDLPTDSTGGGDTSRLGEADPPSEEAVAAAAQSPRPVSQASGSTAPADPSPETKEEDEERLTKAKLIEYGRLHVKMKKAARRKARERAAKEKAQGLLTITFKCHKDDRRLIMGVMKSLNLTVEQMHKANLSTEPLEAAVTKLLREFYKSR